MFGASGKFILGAIVFMLLLSRVAVFAQEDAVPPADAAQETTVEGEQADRIGSAMERFAESATPVDTGDAPGGLGTFIETVIILALFVFGIYGVFRFVQKKRGTTVSGIETIRVLSSLSAGGSRMLQLVGVGDQVFFIGVADNAVNLISEITDKETIDWIRMVHSKGQPVGTEGFVEKLFSMLGKDNKAGAAQRTEGKVDFLEQQKKRLSRMHDQ
jgi:flagellar protein FliO/FliZ